MATSPDAARTTWTISRLLSWTNEFLAAHQLDEPRLCAEILLAHAIGCQRIQLYTRFDDVPDPEILAVFRQLVQKAADHTPIAYLVGHREFFSISFEVTPEVLIPRPETEALVQRAIDLCKTAAWQVPHVLDLGTGSGCIIVAILTHLPHAGGTATDICDSALALARRNAAKHHLEDRIAFISADGLNLPADAIPTGGFHLMVCNPPYVAEAEMRTLPPGVRDHEPHIALTPGGDGLAFFRTIVAGAPPLLTPDGSVLVEIGAGQRDDVQRIMTADGRFTHAGTYRSSADPHDRVMHFVKV